MAHSVSGLALTGGEKGKRRLEPFKNHRLIQKMKNCRKTFSVPSNYTKGAFLSQTILGDPIVA